jgi:hypothetical protein
MAKEKVKQALGNVEKKNKFIDLLKANSEKVIELSSKIHDEFVNETKARQEDKEIRYGINNPKRSAVPFRI